MEGVKAFKRVVGARATAPAAVSDRTPSVEELYAAHAELVWRTLFRMGVAEADLPDMLQEVFVVVHRRIASYDREARPTTWLYGICRRVAARYRRKAHRRRERAVDAVPERSTGSATEDALEARDAQRRLDAILDQLDVDKRAILVMFEVEELSCHEIAAALDIPLGTVHSRLHAARKAFRKAYGRLAARKGGPR
jgi:RNA polymerase sigma-70 factor (ECF subfamily)